MSIHGEKESAVHTGDGRVGASPFVLLKRRFRAQSVWTPAAKEMNKEAAALWQETKGASFTVFFFSHFFFQA